MNRYNFLSLVALLAIVIAIPLYTLQEQKRLSHAQEELQAQSIGNGTVIYLEFCADCHGPSGEGSAMNPALDRLGMADADPDMLFKVIARAAHGSSMASWHLEEGGFLNDYQIKELVTLIRFADWSDIQQIAAGQGFVVEEIATRDIEDTSIGTLTQENPHQCISCHEDPQVHMGRFGQDCVRCHSLEAWLPASLTRHTFQLDHGSGGELACEICHIDSYAENTCYECHDHQPEEMAELHDLEGIADYDNCQICHPTGVQGEGETIWQEILERNKNKSHSALNNQAQ